MSFKVHLGHKLNNKCAQTMFRRRPSCRVIKQLRVQLIKVKVRAKAKRSSKLPHGSFNPRAYVSLPDRNIIISFTLGPIAFSLKLSTLFHFSDLILMLTMFILHSESLFRRFCPLHPLPLFPPSHFSFPFLNVPIVSQVPSLRNRNRNENVA